MATHDYTSPTWGHNYNLTKTGTTISGVIWGDGLQRGDHLLLPNRQRTTRYRITKLTYYRDPGDMADFDARPAPTTAADST